MKGKKKLFAMLIGVAMAIMAVITPVSAANAETSRQNAKDGQVTGMTIRTYKVTETLSNNDKGGFDKVYLSKDRKFSVLKEDDGYFLIKLSTGQNTWVETDEVLINVKDYIPSIDVRLDMAQSENMFSMGGETISGLTDKQFYTAKGSTKGTECWLKYKSAQKLLKAQKAFNKDGDGIVIFDAYRPYTASMEFKDAYSNWLGRKGKSFKTKWFGSLGESWFLAQKASSHNYGHAVDMTIKKISTGKLLKMPTAMHTLDIRSAYSSWAYSKTTAGENALYMKKVMEANGFNYLKSEWWHFQLPKTYWGDVIDVPN